MKRVKITITKSPPHISQTKFIHANERERESRGWCSKCSASSFSYTYRVFQKNAEATSITSLSEYPQELGIN